MSRSGKDSPVAFLAVRVTPRSSRSEIVSWENDVLKIRLNSPPVGGRANREMISLLAKSLGVARSSVEVSAGTKGRDKRLRILGLAPEELETHLADFKPKED